MNVLVGCEESQRVCMAFRERGHTAWSCDIQPCSGGHPEWHILGDCLPLLGGDCEFTTEAGGRHVQSGRWDLLIAHPPCTYLSAAGAVRLFDKDHQIKDMARFEKMMQAAAFFRMFIHANADRIAIENPVPLKVADLPPYSQIIEPYWFGEPWQKRTCLWLMGLPKLCPTDMVERAATGSVRTDTTRRSAECRRDFGIRRRDRKPSPASQKRWQNNGDEEVTTMTDRQRQMIEAYIPGDPDPELDFAEYYMTDAADRVIRVRASSIAYTADDREIREVIAVGKRPHPVYGGRGECGRMPGWYYVRALYDNKRDCKDDTHWMYDEWERLREIQHKEVRNA